MEEEKEEYPEEVENFIEVSGQGLILNDTKQLETSPSLIEMTPDKSKALATSTCPTLASEGFTV